MHDVVCDVLDKISKPLIEKIDFYIHANPNEPEYLLEAFRHPVSWMVAEPYRDMEFEFEHATFTLIALCNVVDLLHGKSTEYDFIDELTKQVREMVAGRIQLFLDQLADDRQRKFNFEREVTIQYAMGIS